MFDSNSTENPYQVTHLPQRKLLGLDEVQFQFAGKSSLYDLPYSLAQVGQWIALTFFCVLVSGPLVLGVANISDLLQFLLCLFAIGLLAQLHSCLYWNRWRMIQHMPELSEKYQGTIDAHWFSFTRANGFVRISTSAIKEWQCRRSRVTVSHAAIPTKTWFFTPHWFASRQEYNRFLNWAITMDEYLTEKRSLKKLKITQPTLDHVQAPAVHLLGIPPGKQWGGLSRIAALASWKTSERVKYLVQIIVVLGFCLLWLQVTINSVQWIFGNLFLMPFGVHYIFFAFEQINNRGTLKFLVPSQIAIDPHGMHGLERDSVFFRGWSDFAGYIPYGDQILLQPRGVKGTFYLLQKSGVASDQEWSQVETWVGDNLAKISH